MESKSKLSFPKLDLATRRCPELVIKKRLDLVLPIFFAKDVYNQLYSKPKSKDSIDQKDYSNQFRHNKPKSQSSIRKSSKGAIPPARLMNISFKSIEATYSPYQSYLYASQILDWLYLGSYSNATDRTELKTLNIKYILNCAIECKNVFENEFVYKHLKMIDMPDYQIGNNFSAAFSFFQYAIASKSKVLVHCQMGISRSATIVIAFLMKNYSYTLKQAFILVKSKRKQVCPNFGFMEQLIKLESLIVKKKSK